MLTPLAKNIDSRWYTFFDLTSYILLPQKIKVKNSKDIQHIRPKSKTKEDLSLLGPWLPGLLPQQWGDFVEDLTHGKRQKPTFCCLGQNVSIAQAAPSFHLSTQRCLLILALFPFLPPAETTIKEETTGPK